jgi:hypothetical protein
MDAISSPSLLYDPPIDDVTWLMWGATHQSDHFQLADGIRTKTGLTVPVLPIDPVPLPGRGALETDMLLWFQNHQLLHNALNAVLGIGNIDLSYVDFRNVEQMAVWIRYNAYLHQATAAAIATFQPPQQPGQQPVGIFPQPGPNTQIQPQQQAVLPQGNPGVQVIMPQSGGVQPQAALGPQPAEQPFATLQPQPAPQPTTPQPGTPLQPGGGFIPH